MPDGLRRPKATGRGRLVFVETPDPARRRPALVHDQTKAAGTRYRVHGEGGRTFDPPNTALLVIDPVNDFLPEDDTARELIESTVTKQDVIGAEDLLPTRPPSGSTSR